MNPNNIQIILLTGKPFLSLPAPGDLPCGNSPPLSLRTCHWASNSSGWPKRGLAAGTLHIIGRVPNRPRCSLQEKVFLLEQPTTNFSRAQLGAINTVFLVKMDRIIDNKF
jgi:hypothetical protein